MPFHLLWLVAFVFISNPAHSAPGAVAVNDAGCERVISGARVKPLSRPDLKQLIGQSVFVMQGFIDRNGVGPLESRFLGATLLGPHWDDGLRTRGRTRPGSDVYYEMALEFNNERGYVEIFEASSETLIFGAETFKPAHPTFAIGDRVYDRETEAVREIVAYGPQETLLFRSTRWSRGVFHVYEAMRVSDVVKITVEKRKPDTGTRARATYLGGVVGMHGRWTHPQLLALASAESAMLRGLQQRVDYGLVTYGNDTFLMGPEVRNLQARLIPAFPEDLAERLAIKLILDHDRIEDANADAAGRALADKLSGEQRNLLRMARGRGKGYPLSDIERADKISILTRSNGFSHDQALYLIENGFAS